MRNDLTHHSTVRFGQLELQFLYKPTSHKDKVFFNSSEKDVGFFFVCSVNYRRWMDGSCAHC